MQSHGSKPWIKLDQVTNLITEEWKILAIFYSIKLKRKWLDSVDDILAAILTGSPVVDAIMMTGRKVSSYVVVLFVVVLTQVCSGNTSVTERI